jgi:prepilin-type N-terminal cleavage/methylation domain-containing protein
LNKKGFTLVELLIYVALFSIIFVFFGRQLKSLSNFYASGKEVAREQADSRDIVSIMARDIRNTGLKWYLNCPTPDNCTKIRAPGVFVSATDTSSFIHAQGTIGDALTIMKARINKSTGNLDGVDSIKYYLSGNTLKRDYNVSGSAAATQTTDVAENVYALQFAYGLIAANDLLVDQGTGHYASSGWTWTHSGSETRATTGSTPDNLTFTGAATGYLQYNTAINVYQNRKYSITLNIETSNGFPGNLAWLQFSMGTSHSTLYCSEKFKPYTSLVQFTVAVQTTGSVNAYLDYSATGAGNLIIKGVEVRCSKLGQYNWANNFTAAGTAPDSLASHKINVRAIRVYLLMRSPGKMETTETSSIVVGDVTIARSGPYTWRLYTETIEMPNNGP